MVQILLGKARPRDLYSARKYLVQVESVGH